MIFFSLISSDIDTLDYIVDYPMLVQSQYSAKILWTIVLFLTFLGFCYCCFLFKPYIIG